MYVHFKVKLPVTEQLGTLKNPYVNFQISRINIKYLSISIKIAKIKINLNIHINQLFELFFKIFFDNKYLIVTRIYV